MLELGCGDGANALSIAQTLPGASVLGIDASPRAIERGGALARAAGLENVRLRCATFESLAPELGSFDYILSHGVYSWVPPAVRGALLECIKRCLAPRGIAFVSYNAYPGSYLRDMARDILNYHVRTVSDPQERLARAHELMQTIVAIEEPSPFARVLREHMERMLGYSDALLFHDDLAEVSTPFYFHEFMEHSEHHGLQFLSEADLFESQMREVPESAGRLMAALADDVLAREQYLDFFKNRMFRQTLLCHAEIGLSHALDDRAIEGLAIASSARPGEQEPDSAHEAPVGDPDTETFVTPEGFTVSSSEPLVRAALRTLADASPQALAYPLLLDAVMGAIGVPAPNEQVAGRLREVLLAAYLARIVQLYGCAPELSPRPGERPLASPLARAQLAAGLPAVSSLLHANVRLDGEDDRRLLALLDGTRDRGALLDDIPASDLDDALERFAALGLLHA